MSLRYFFPSALAAALFCGLCRTSALAQPPDPKPISDLPYPTISTAQAEELVNGDTRIALHLHDVTLESALQTLEKQSGISLGLDQSFNPTDRAELQKMLSIDLETPSFNEALRALIERANVKAKLTRRGTATGEMAWTILFNPKEPLLERAPQSGVGRFQIRVNNLSSTFSKTVTAGANNTFTRAQENRLGINFQVAPDPQMPDVTLPILRVSRAEDEKGRSLLAPPRPLFPGYMRRGYGANYGFSELNPLPADTRQLAHLEGVAICALPSSHEKWEVPDLLNAAGWTHDFGINQQHYSFTIASVERDAESIRVKIQMAPSFDSQRLTQKMKLQNGEGRVFSTRGSSSDGTTTEIEFSLSDRVGANAAAAEPAPLSPLRLSFDVPIEWVQTAVPFSFENVPLPQVDSPAR